MHSLKYLMFEILSWEDIGIRKSEFVAKTQFLYISSDPLFKIHTSPFKP